MYNFYHIAIYRNYISKNKNWNTYMIQEGVIALPLGLRDITQRLKF